MKGTGSGTTAGTAPVGIARKYALVFGIAYLSVALIETLIGRDGIQAGSTTLLQYTPLQNAVHWLVGLVVLGSFFVGETAAKVVARIVGIVFVALTVWGLVAAESLGELLGFRGSLPWTYTLVHGLTAAAALFAGFAAERAYANRPSRIAA